ncbi:GNAT family N-acetyltransferase [Amycolatopsis sp. H20-H5]|uniref:GNAT family N-acetyltransferase n=1 Tax=Amycolatopsis sp. H20-H5 TaxID=3046309 RepID=UPI002DB604B3|nr:GNAT family N-acetyltransferase [Amycolatopsis sp. H20-H5]MEC3977031.1 GNAT family N-acetyltransferase [Amycolatopsis sp. H20-H5]
MHDLQSYIRTTAARGRETEQVGPFLATFSPHSDNPFLNYAIPDDDSVPTVSDVDGLIEAYRRRSLSPRLEFLTEAAPQVEAVLAERGFALERRVPLMICPRDEVTAQRVPECVELLTPDLDLEYRAMIEAQNEAFGETGPISDEDVDRARELPERGGIALLAVHAISGDPVGGGFATALLDGTTEVAGIGVREKYQRRGVAGAIVESLTREAHSRGAHTVFLTPGHGPAQRVYTRVGYRTAGECVHLSIA